MRYKLLNNLAKQHLQSWLQAQLEAENRHLTQQIHRLKQQLDCLNAYIDGLEKGMRAGNRILHKAGGSQ